MLEWYIRSVMMLDKSSGFSESIPARGPSRSRNLLILLTRQSLYSWGVQMSLKTSLFSYAAIEKRRTYLGHQNQVCQTALFLQLGGGIIVLNDTRLKGEVDHRSPDIWLQLWYRHRRKWERKLERSCCDFESYMYPWTPKARTHTTHTQFTLPPWSLCL